jgi:hypothetical protein
MAQKPCDRGAVVGAGRHGVGTHTPVRMMVRPAISFSVRNALIHASRSRHIQDPTAEYQSQYEDRCGGLGIDEAAAGIACGKELNQAAPTRCSSSAMTPQSPGCGHPTT